MRLRSAPEGDLGRVVDLSKSMRHQLASWSPVYFRARDGADEAHAAFLAFLVRSDEHRTYVVESAGEVVGFFHLVSQPSHWWVDDLCVDDPAVMPGVASMLVTQLEERPWVTCVSFADEVRARALTDAGLVIQSSYWSRLLTATDAEPSELGELGRSADGVWPRHTFGGEPFDPHRPGALVLGDNEGNRAVGSPPVEPPIYDPGGPTTIVDRLEGSRRGVALTRAIAHAAARGDAQLIVVANHDDHMLHEDLSVRGFARQVDLFGLVV